MGKKHDQNKNWSIWTSCEGNFRQHEPSCPILLGRRKDSGEPGGDFEIGEMLLHRAPKPPCDLQQTKPRLTTNMDWAEKRGHAATWKHEKFPRIFSFLFCFLVSTWWIPSCPPPHVARTQANTMAGYLSTAAAVAATAACLPNGTVALVQKSIWFDCGWRIYGCLKESRLILCPDNGFRSRCLHPMHVSEQGCRTTRTCNCPPPSEMGMKWKTDGSSLRTDLPCIWF